MLNIRATIYDYKISLRYEHQLGLNKCAMVQEWLEENVGVENVDWHWERFTIALDSREDMVALKLKFGL